MKYSSHVFTGLLAIMGSALISPITNPIKNDDRTVPNWFRFHGGDQNDPNNFSSTVSVPDCTGGSNLCAILAEPNPQEPASPLMETITERAFHE